MPLPDTTTPVDVQVYVNGKLNSSLSDSYKNILPSVVGNLKLKCTEQAASYNVTIMLSVAGKNDYKQYASYTADALAGSSKLEGTPIWTGAFQGHHHDDHHRYDHDHHHDHHRAGVRLTIKGRNV